MITSGDGAIQREIVTSGFTTADHRRIESWGPEGLDFFDHLNGLPGPIRHPNLAEYVRIGGFYLGGKEDGREFTDEDEEVMLLFASHAAAALVNARAHLHERRARADLEALVETSPVGVVVIDLRSGRPMSLNREARRIVEGLRMPGGTVEELKDALVVRRADGRKLPLAEARLAQALRSVGTVRAEEVLLSVPGGRSATALVNATPIRSADGAVESLVVTMQDMAPLQQLERLRAEFLGMVSHELRAPLTSISASACPSARGWWRRTAAASGPRAAEPGRAPGSPSRFGRRRKRAPRPASPVNVRGPPGNGATRS